MADYTALYEAGNALIELFKKNMTPEPISKPELIGLCSPFEPEDYQLTVYLYHIEDATNAGLPPFTRENVRMERARPTPLKLLYMVTAHSKAPVQTRAADEHRVMGRIIQIVRDNGQLTGEKLNGSLKETGTTIHVQQLKVTFDAMQRIWNNTQKPYKLSILLEVSPVEIDSLRIRTHGRVKDIEINVEDGGYRY